ncbi:MAG TPA: hypothetical protein VE986_04945, partial [Hyphomicrobiales bacterium]|nr:hypothetical protein [Hyphomicrobiales bacterium]
MSTNKQHSSACVWEALNAHPLAERSIHSPSESFPLQALTEASALEGGSARLAGRSVLVWTAEQLTAALAFIELDGVARRIVLCPPGLEESELPAICEKTEAGAIITDRARAAVD